MQAFATATDFQDALAVFLAEFTGQKPATSQIALAAVNVLSFGTGQLLGAPPANTMTALPDGFDRAAFIRGILDESKKMHAAGDLPAILTWLQNLPWGTIMTIAWQLLVQALPWLSAFVPVTPAVRVPTAAVEGNVITDAMQRMAVNNYLVPYLRKKFPDLPAADSDWQAWLYAQVQLSQS